MEWINKEENSIMVSKRFTRRGREQIPVIIRWNGLIRRRKKTASLGGMD